MKRYGMVIGLDPDRHRDFLSRWLTGGMRYHAIRGNSEFRDRGPGNVAWYGRHKVAPPMRPPQVYPATGEPI